MEVSVQRMFNIVVPILAILFISSSAYSQDSIKVTIDSRGIGSVIADRIMFEINLRIEEEEYQSAFDKVETLKRTFLEPIIVVNDIKDEKVRFKVMMGEFQTMSEAESFQKILHDDFSIESIIN